LSWGTAFDSRNGVAGLGISTTSPANIVCDESHSTRARLQPDQEHGRRGALGLNFQRPWLRDGLCPRGGPARPIGCLCERIAGESNPVIKSIDGGLTWRSAGDGLFGGPSSAVFSSTPLTRRFSI
jgi:hypothetical protein